MLDGEVFYGESLIDDSLDAERADKKTHKIARLDCLFVCFVSFCCEFL